MGRPINKEKVLEEKGELKQYTLFRQTKSDKLEWLLAAYEQDPYKARVLFFNSRPDCYIQRDVSFERTDGSFEICCFKRTYGMTKTNRIYSREKKTKSLIYKNKKFYFKNGVSIKHAMYTDISCHFDFATEFLQEKFKWLRNIKENKFCHNISLSSVMTYKLFNAEKILKHLYKAPLPVINVLTKEYEEKSKGYGDGCGQLMYDAWGGKSALSWAESKIRQSEKMSFEIQDEEERIISGPLMLADTPIYRYDSSGEYYVVFTADTIKKIAQKYFKKGYQSNVNLMHDNGMTVEGVTMFESWIVDEKRGIKAMKGFEDVKDGSWFGSFKVENEDVWELVKEGKLKGFSVEGVFNYSKSGISNPQKMMQDIIDILHQLS
jgi:hypothetical protein